MSFFRNNLHPTRGRKHIIQCVIAVSVGNNSHPVRGRKLFHFLHSSISLRNNLHPIRERKLKKFHLCHNMTSETTYTPQGDGNPVTLTPVTTLSETTYTSQGDGNKSHPLFIALQTETTYTPQGDENRCIPKTPRNRHRNNLHPLHPARGRKLFCHFVKILIPKATNLHPVRGRKPYLADYKQHKIIETTYTLQGDGNQPLFISIVVILPWNNLHPARGRKQKTSLTQRI